MSEIIYHSTIGIGEAAKRPPLSLSVYKDVLTTEVYHLVIEEAATVETPVKRLVVQASQLSMFVELSAYINTRIQADVSKDSSNTFLNENSVEMSFEDKEPSKSVLSLSARRDGEKGYFCGERCCLVKTEFNGPKSTLPDAELTQISMSSAKLSKLLNSLADAVIAVDKDKAKQPPT